MRVEVAYRGRIEAFDTDRFTEAQPFSGKSMLADLTLDYADVEKKGLWLTAHCYAPREAAGIESVTLDGSTVLARLFGELVDVARVDRACALFVGHGGSLASRIVRLSGYLANDDERLAASQALMAEAVGVTPLTLERAVEAEAAQEVPADDMEDDWMEGFGND